MTKQSSVLEGFWIYHTMEEVGEWLLSVYQMEVSRMAMALVHGFLMWFTNLSMTIAFCNS